MRVHGHVPSTHITHVATRENGEWVVRAAAAHPERCGAKAMGLSLLPAAWTIPWVVVDTDACILAKADDSWISLSTCLLRHLSGGVDSPHKLIVRSSASDENMDLRGHYESAVCESTPKSLASTLHQVAYQEVEADCGESSRPACAVVVQRYLEPVRLGHLSNEYRHAQRNVDFLYEYASLADPTASRPGSFRLPRPVEPPTSEAMQVALAVTDRRDALERCLRLVSSWLAGMKLRGHIEWLQVEDRLYLVQLDVDQLPERRNPMEDAPISARLAPPSEDIGAPFITVDRGDFRSLRKTRSHALLHAAGAFVPPIYVATGVGQDIHDMASPFWVELAKLLVTPAVIRFDVPIEREEWTNLPTVVTSGEDVHNVFERVQRAVRQVADRGVSSSLLSVVVHHFIAARASAWSEASPGKSDVRIDAIWGLPDGLQTFVHDSIIHSATSDTISPQIRYKDRFLDVARDGSWFVRPAPPSLARVEVIDVKQARTISRISMSVAKEAGCTVRIMWFVDVVSGDITCGDTLMPWIVVELDDERSSALRSGSLSPDRLLALQRRVDLSGTRAIKNRRDLSVLRTRPHLYDLGDRHVLLQPDAGAVRDRTFLKEFAEVVRALTPPWKVVYAGSILAHAPYQLQQFGVAVIPLHEEVRPPRRTLMRKLVRDGIPERVRAGGEVADAVVLGDEEFVVALRQKLVEEALEVAYSADEDELREELADLLAVARTLCQAGGAGEWSDVEAKALDKESKRGGFDGKVYLRATGYYRRGEDDVPGRADVVRLKHNEGVRLPLVPPLVPQDRRQIVELPSLGVGLVVTYGDQVVEVRLLRRGRREQPSPQLLLFDESAKDADEG